MSEIPQPLLGQTSSAENIAYWNLAISISKMNHKSPEENLNKILNRERFIHSKSDLQLPKPEETSIILDIES